MEKWREEVNESQPSENTERDKDNEGPKSYLFNPNWSPDTQIFDL